MTDNRTKNNKIKSVKPEKVLVEFNLTGDQENTDELCFFTAASMVQEGNDFEIFSASRKTKSDMVYPLYLRVSDGSKMSLSYGDIMPLYIDANAQTVSAIINGGVPLPMPQPDIRNSCNYFHSNLTADGGDVDAELVLKTAFEPPVVRKLHISVRKDTRI